jgi:tripartite tricarboxylate transporter TctB family protein
MINPRVELAITLAFLGAILVGLYLTSRIDLVFSSELETFSGPRAYPALILSIMLLLFGGIAASQLRAVRRETVSEPKFAPFFSARSIRSAVLFASLLVFVLSFESVGYILTMVPLLTFVALLCGAKNWIQALAVAVCLTAVCLLTFRYGLATVLPEGWFGIDEIL